ncbi:HSP20-like chaperone [Tanacetum coccineum]
MDMSRGSLGHFKSSSGSVGISGQLYLVSPGSVITTGSILVSPGSVITTGSILVSPGSVITTGSILVSPGSVITTGTSLDPPWSDLELHLSGDEFEPQHTRRDKEVTKQTWWPRVVMEVLGCLLGDMVVRSCRHPTLKWAQRADVIFITIDLPDAKDVKLKLEPKGKLYFSARAGADNIPYEIDVNLHDKVDVNESKSSVGSRSIIYLIKKKESKWWTRLLKQEGKTSAFVKVDWDKQVDEDEQDEKADMDFGDMAFSISTTSNLNLGGGEGFDAEDDTDTEEEVKEEEVIRKQEVAPPWAQRADVIFITIDLPDAKDVKLKLDPEGKLYFSARAGADNIPYEIDVNLHDKVDVNESKSSVGSRSIIYLIKKKESKWWTRLLKQEGKTPAFMKVDWDKRVDEDEQDEKADMDFGDMAFSNLNMGGGEGFDAEGDEDDTDTEEEAKEEEAIGKQEVTPPVSNQVEATT